MDPERPRGVTDWEDTSCRLHPLADYVQKVLRFVPDRRDRKTSDVTGFTSLPTACGAFAARGATGLASCGPWDLSTRSSRYCVGVRPVVRRNTIPNRVAPEKPDASAIRDTGQSVVDSNRFACWMCANRISAASERPIASRN